MFSQNLMVHAEQEIQFLAIAQPQPQNVCKNDDYNTIQPAGTAGA